MRYLYLGIYGRETKRLYQFTKMLTFGAQQQYYVPIPFLLNENKIN